MIAPIIDINVSTIEDAPTIDVNISTRLSAFEIEVDMADMTSHEHYEGTYIVTPKAFEEQTLSTTGFLMDDDVTVLEIPYHITSNPSGGNTASIA